MLNRWLMESNHQASAYRGLPPVTQFPDPRFLPEFGRRDGYLGQQLGWSRQEQLQHYHPYCHHTPHYIDMYEIPKREFEMQHFREDIIMSGVTRTHVSEVDVRRRLMMEINLALQRAGNRLSFSSLQDVLFESLMRLPRPITRVEERFIIEQMILKLYQERERLNGMHESWGRFDMLPFQRANVAPRISEISVPDREGAAEQKIVMLVKPDENISGSKRNAVTLYGVDASDFLKKKAKVEWSCAVCQFNACTEKEFSKHLRGRKHQREEAKLRRAHKGSSNFRIGFCRKESVNNKIVAESLQLSNVGVTCSKTNDCRPLEENLNLVSSMKNDQGLVRNMQNGKRTRKRKRKAQEKNNRKLAGLFHEFEKYDDKDMLHINMGMARSKSDVPASLQEIPNTPSLKKHEMEEVQINQKRERSGKKKRKAQKRKNRKRAGPSHELYRNGVDCQI